MSVSLEDVERAHGRITSSIVRTPFELSRTLSAETGAELYLKHENQQFTASFKERGALNRLLDLSDQERRKGPECESRADARASRRGDPARQPFR
jgi:threonine dehydratase